MTKTLAFIMASLLLTGCSASQDKHRHLLLSVDYREGLQTMAQVPCNECNDRLREFARLVKAMRDSQAKFFATKSGEVLSQAKKLEREVDQQTAELLASGPKQSELFK